ncbi:MAG: hypothetical protein IPN62_15340 [Flavobacteriales bacterium]|nr:hypothetical protein [Flavobacteriales bacterium]
MMRREAVGAPTVLVGLEDAVADGVVVPAAGLGDEGDTELYARYFAFIEEFGGELWGDGDPVVVLLFVGAQGSVDGIGAFEDLGGHERNGQRGCMAVRGVKNHTDRCRVLSVVRGCRWRVRG